jgi:hypothetical protein
MDIRQGDILFVYGEGLLDEAIEDITHGPSHCVVISSDNNQKVIEAQSFRQVGYQDLSFYLSSNIRIYRLPNTQANIDLGMQWLIRQLGRPYDYYDIFILFVRCMFKLKLPWKEGKRILCSRLVRDFIFQSKLNIPDENMTPKDVEDWVIANGGVLVVDTVNKSK